MPEIIVVEGDITNMRVDAIVNAANNSLLGGGGVDGAIHRAGGPAILAACRELRATTLPDGLPTGDAVATTGGNLHVQWVIHTVGPVYSEDEDRTDLLRSAYIRSLAVADSLGARSVAFPLISAGAYGWPRAAAVDLAVEAILSAPTRADEVLMVAYDRDIAELMRRSAP
ncbi:O-acetyl-ADP-ribose deacetylase [Tomitella biformata]|uniref:O-acetyl-ADP-ribose deacetylase n=1 Tax=Tomitella biformata TaxID=630403 RepID=UPI00046788E9|nr:O-acetyl-ADP-ribose deacetylase [Tomitella biformata]